MRSAACCQRKPTRALAGLKMAVRTRPSSCWTAIPLVFPAWQRAINCWISWFWARRSSGGRFQIGQ